MVHTETETIFKQGLRPLNKITKKHSMKTLCGTLDYPDLAKIDDVCILG